ncbi:hypothetical protein F4678DRAFT_474398 [Xylaria arbuscula]|nr:hypothetical protein F4678DRAFT_474398 [Xylaria arbuscula]
MASDTRDWQDPDAVADMEMQEATRQDSAVERHEAEGDPRHSDVSTTTDPDLEKSNRSSGSHWGSEPGFEQIDGDIEGRGYNETSVDIIAVPCIGASPIDTWARDPLSDGYFTFPPSAELDKFSTVKELPGSSVLSPTIDRVLPKASHIWIRQGIRKEVNNARVMLYRHRELADGMTIDMAADDLIEQITKMRAGLNKARPIFFICHSIGGLVVKSALVKARKREDLRPIVYDCYGITFFATPHRGSSYLSMPHLRESIQHLLFLERPLPRSITNELRIGYKPLLKLHDKFKDIASELRVWTFYETVDSQLSGLGSYDFDEVHFSAPITSIKSGLVGSRAEQALSLESDHAHCASFGPQNLRIMHSYLYDLGAAVRKAELLSSAFVHTPLRLAEKVKIELIAFYDDPDSETDRSIRLYVSKHYLSQFLDKGPEDCLRERMNTMAPRTRRAMLPPSRRLAASPPRLSGPASVWSGVRELGQRILGSSHSSDGPQSPEPDIPHQPSPEIVVTSHTPRRPSLAGSSTEPLPAVDVSPRRSRGLTVPALATPGFIQPSSRRSNESVRSNIDGGVRTLSEPITDVSPKTIEGPQNPDEDKATNEPQAEGGKPDTTRRSRRDHISRAAAWQDLTAGFSRPDPAKRKFMWIHLPFNNPYWVKHIFDKLSESTNKSYSKLLSNDYWTSKHVQGRRANWHVSYVKPGCAFVPAEKTIPRPPSPNRNGRSVSPNVSPAHFYLFIPYLHYDTYVNIIQRRNIIRRRKKHGRARPVPKDIAELESLESRVMWEFIGHDPPLNARRTLDQYGYPALQDTWARDDDQMLYKLTRERTADPLKRKRDMYHTGEDLPSAVTPTSRLASTVDKLTKTDNMTADEEAESDPEAEVVNGNVLMIDQLWLWAVDNNTLLTFFPKRESHPIEGPLFQQADLRNSIYNELNGDLTGRCENALDLAAFVTLHAVTVLLDRSGHPDLEIFRIFDEAIGILTERMTSSLKRFRMESYNKTHDESGTEDPQDNRTEAIKKRHNREVERAERQNRENTSAVLELRDMEDELHTLLNLFTEQQDTVKSMKASYEKSELQAATEYGRQYLEEALRRLEEYEKQAHDMLTRVDATRKDFEKLQEMIQRQAQVDEVRWSRLQAELASSQNLSVMIFTTFTVIFLPLSFFTSLFGMNTQEWGGPDPNNFLSLKLIGAISLPASAFLIAITLVAAFSGRIQGLIKMIYRYFEAFEELCYRPINASADRLNRLRTQSSKESAEKRKRMKELEKKRLQRERERGYDFWGAVRAERRSEYEIPEMNRKRALRSRVPGRGTWGRLIADETR